MYFWIVKLKDVLSTKYFEQHNIYFSGLLGCYQLDVSTELVDASLVGSHIHYQNWGTEFWVEVKKYQDERESLSRQIWNWQTKLTYN